ncbi:MAG: META domain-containing protein [Gammaproteobacteria bacterium]|nr:META domain-containing protein [Gammaproteobacteria bacterium]MCP5424834.1 META domain-containing protein [Gammaproteobacteria bacterium]MCP5458189.1 META domain-containing protein [Gammaproteobacteria bacterium]
MNPCVIVFAVVLAWVLPVGPVWADPLASWNDTSPKKAVIEFVERVTKAESADYVPEPERIAVFDNDGTLWPENPVPTQIAFAVDELKSLVQFHPEWNDDAYVQAALDGDTATLLANHETGLLRVISLTHAGMSTDEFRLRVQGWLATAKHPRFGRPYTDVVYQPMLELLAYLRANGFKTYIVSGGGADFMRVWSEPTYAIPPEQVIGSTAQTRFEWRSDYPVLIKTVDNIFVDDKAGKPVAIHQYIGRRPIACFGNSDGDQAMLEYTTIGNPRPSFGLLVHHTDAEREYAYDAEPQSSGKLVDALIEAQKRGWTVVSMRDDWKRIWPDSPAPLKALAAVPELPPEPPPPPPPPPPTLFDNAWVVEDINGRGVVERAPTYIRFEEDGRVTGDTGCNPFNGSAVVKENTLKIGPLATTRRACKPAILKHEIRFLDAIAKIHGFAFDKEGTLRLVNSAGTALLRLSPLLEVPANAPPFTAPGNPSP